MGVNVKLGENTINNVNSVELNDAVSGKHLFNLALNNTINFIADNTDYSVVSVKSGVDITAPKTPTKSGYVFKGWGLTDSATSYVSFPYTPSAAQLNLYAIYMAASKCICEGLGSSSPSNVVFTKDTTFTLAGLGIEEVVIDGNTFIKIPTMYKKFDTVVSNQLTKFTIANAQIDSSYQPYPCFIDENNNLLEYILIGKYWISSSSVANSVNATVSSMAIGTGRTLCRAKTNENYQGLLYDWQIHQLWRDLIICFKQTVNTNSGSGIGTDYIDDLGIRWGTSSCWIDGLAGKQGSFVFSYKPSKYIDSPTSSSDSYNVASYIPGFTTDIYNITKLGYDANHPFVNMPSSVSGLEYITYYCDGFTFGTSGFNVLRPFRANVGWEVTNSGAFSSYFDKGWSDTYSCRLCLRPIV